MSGRSPIGHRLLEGQGVVALALLQALNHEVPRVGQCVEKVGSEPVATTNRVLNGPKAACLVSFGAGPGVRMATKGVFQQPGVFPEVAPALLTLHTLALTSPALLREVVHDVHQRILTVAPQMIVALPEHLRSRRVLQARQVRVSQSRRIVSS